MSSLMYGILWVLSALLSLFIGGFLKSYVSKKGENLATHEDIQKLVDQMAAVTKATKEIEAKISDDVWARQRRWELKREIALEAMKTIADLVWACTQLFALRREKEKIAGIKNLPSVDQLPQTQYEIDLWELFRTAMGEFTRIYGSIAIVLDRDVCDQFMQAHGLLCQLNVDKSKTEAPTDEWSRMSEAMQKLDTLTEAIRRDLGFADPQKLVGEPYLA